MSVSGSWPWGRERRHQPAQWVSRTTDDELPSADGDHAVAERDPSYPDVCLDPNVEDYDCAGGSGNGPYYVQGPITVVGDDHYGLDRDGDGVACES